MAFFTIFIFASFTMSYAQQNDNVLSEFNWRKTEKGITNTFGMVEIKPANKMALSINVGAKSNFMVASDGSINCREIIFSKEDFPDYVFDDKYEIMPLEALKNYIDENRHLPEVPTAREAKENSIGLVELSIVQMKKIEELTLYLIELNKEVEKFLLN